MLYITTRDNKDAYTANRTLNLDYAPDNGQFVPFKFPEFDLEDIHAMAHKGFGEIVADILNLFFSAHLTGWDVDFCIGRNSLKIASMNHKLMVAEIWHNSGNSIQFAERALYKRIYSNADDKQMPTDWVKIAVRIALLFGIYGQLLSQQNISVDQPLDIAVAADDFDMTVAAWYARKIGLPIGTIVCSFSKDNAAWDIIHHGQANTSANNLPIGLERLIHDILGCEETMRYLGTIEQGGVYSVPEEYQESFCKEIFPAVVGSMRIDSIIGSMYKTNAYVFDPDTAQAFGGLQDFRASVGENRYALLISESNPSIYSDRISLISGIPANKLN